MAGPKVSKPFLVVAVVGLVLIIGVLGFTVLGGGGGGSSTTKTTSASASAPATAATSAGGATSASATTTTTPPAPSTPGQSFDVFTTKNPFQPLVTASSSTGTTGTGTGSSATTTTTPSGGGGVTPPATVPANQAPAAGTPVSVLEVYDNSGTTTARVQVGSQVYTVVVGQTFATSYRVVSLDVGTSCGQFQFGDSPFQLCAGQQTLK